MEMKLKPFDLEAAKAGAPVVTRDGKPVRIVCFDAKGSQPLLGLIEWGRDEMACRYSANGEYLNGKSNDHNLVMKATVKRNGWLNLYRIGGMVRAADGGCIYKTKADALDNRAADYVATVPVEWEE